MPGPKPKPIKLSEKQRQAFEQLLRRTTAPQRLVWRARIILLADQGLSNSEIARQLRLSRATVKRWRTRWREALPMLEAVQADEHLWLQRMEKILQDAPRLGGKPTFSAEQVVQIIALACQDPNDSGRPISHWTPRELADEAIKRGIVESISPRSVGRFLKRGQDQTPSISLLAQSRNRGRSTVQRRSQGHLHDLSAST